MAFLTTTQINQKPPTHSAPCGAGQYFVWLPPASLTNGWCLEPRDASAANDRRGNRKLVQTGFVLIFQSINYKNIRLHYTFAILQSHWSVVVCDLPEKKSVSTVTFLWNFCALACSNMAKTKVRIFILFYFDSVRWVRVNSRLKPGCVWYFCIRGTSSSLTNATAMAARAREPVRAPSHSSKIKHSRFLLAKLNICLTTEKTTFSVRDDNLVSRVKALASAAVDIALCKISGSVSVFSPWPSFAGGNVDILNATTNFRYMPSMCNHRINTIA